MNKIQSCKSAQTKFRKINLLMRWFYRLYVTDTAIRNFSMTQVFGNSAVHFLRGVPALGLNVGIDFPLTSTGECRVLGDEGSAADGIHAMTSARATHASMDETI